MPRDDRGVTESRKQFSNASHCDANDLVVTDLSVERLLRKEVIQPQVPLRLPCYDFTPVTSHTMGSYLPCGLSH
jgi:hypothetical protein